LDDPRLEAGWWPMEHAALAFRWTNGDASLRLPDDAAVLALRLHAAMQVTCAQESLAPAAVSARQLPGPYATRETQRRPA